jgi:hypothetical protein
MKMLTISCEVIAHIALLVIAVAVLPVALVFRAIGWIYDGIAERLDTLMYGPRDVW